MSSAGFPRRLATVMVTITAAVLTAAGAVTPAKADLGPSMTVNNGAVNIAELGPNDSLMFYWAVNGSSTWNPETVVPFIADASTPSMVVNGDTVDIAVTDQFSGLVFFWAFNGMSTWHTEDLGGSIINGFLSAPSMAAEGNEIDIAAITSSGDLLLTWALTGTGTWHSEIVSGPSDNFEKPSITFDGGDVNIAREGSDNSLLFFWAINGTAGWNEEIVAGAGTTASSPSMTTNGNAVNISTVGTNNQLMFYWASTVRPTGTPRRSPALAAWETCNQRSGQPAARAWNPGHISMRTAPGMTSNVVDVVPRISPSTSIGSGGSASTRTRSARTSAMLRWGRCVRRSICGEG